MYHFFGKYGTPYRGPVTPCTHKTLKEAVSEVCSVFSLLPKRLATSLLKHKIKTAAALVVILCAHHYYTTFPENVYQTKRIDTIKNPNQPDQSIEYSIEDNESHYGTTFLLNMLSGVGDPKEWKLYLHALGIDTDGMDPIPEDMQNRTLYKALRETHIHCFSPKVRIEPIHGSYKDWSSGKLAYTDHRYHTIYSYFFLKSRVDTMSTRMIQDVLPKSLYTHRELLQDQLLHDIFSELSHTYALGVHKYAYMNKFLQDALPNINIVRDTLPWEMADFPYTSDSVSIYEEEADGKVSIIYRHVPSSQTISRPKLKAGLNHLIGDYFLSTAAYSRSYKVGFEERVHGTDVQGAQVMDFFVAIYEQHMDRNTQREVYDYARLLLGDLGNTPIDSNKGLKILRILAKSGYAPAQRHLTQNCTENIHDLSTPIQQLSSWQRVLRETKTIHDSKTGCMITIDVYDEHEVHE